MTADTSIGGQAMEGSGGGELQGTNAVYLGEGLSS